MDMLTGRVDSQFGILTTTHQYIRDGKLNALGVTTPNRVAEFPEIPTIAEQGLPGYEASLWLGLIAPAKVPADIVAKLNTSINEVLADPDVRTALFNQAIVVDPMSAKAFTDHIGSDIKRWSELAKAAGLVTR
jgi:tripartite-type tricarboxylate transporter receptor subunit TctC